MHLIYKPLFFIHYIVYQFLTHDSSFFRQWRSERKLEYMENWSDRVILFDLQYTLRRNTTCQTNIFMAQSKDNVPNVPPGWKAVFDDEYSTWFYVDLSTKASQWEAPKGTTWPSEAKRPSGPPPPPSYNQSSACLLYTSRCV